MQAHELQHPLDRSCAIDEILAGEKSKFLMFEAIAGREVEREIVLFRYSLEHADAARFWMEEYEISKELLIGGGQLKVEREEGMNIAMYFQAPSLQIAFNRDKPFDASRIDPLLREGKTAVRTLLNSILEQRAHRNKAS